VPEGRTLRPVLRLNMYRQLATKGCLSVWSKDAVWDDAKLTIDIGKTRSHGYADLLVTAKITTDANDGENHGASRVEHQVMRYDGEQYQRQPPAKGETTPWWMGV
jgi:hypothetical protein